MSTTYTPTQQPVSSYNLFKQIYLSWMTDYGQYICSKGNEQFNEDLFDTMMCADKKFNIENPYELMRFISYQNIKVKELFRKYYYNDPRTRNQYSVVSDTELLIQ